jgi:hypothetical protein
MMIGRKKIKRRSKSSSSDDGKKMYFGPEVTDAISIYNTLASEEEKLIIYRVTISPALMKLAESLILIYGFSEPGEDITETQLDCVAFLYENLRKFDSSRGTKAFSYFNVIARNWLIQNSRKRNTAAIRNVSLENRDMLSSKDRNIIANYSIAESPDDVMIQNSKKEYIKNIFFKINKRLIDENEKICMQAIMTIFDHLEDIDILHKRAIFVYIRDMSNLTQKQLSSALSAIRRHYKEIVMQENLE